MPSRTAADTRNQPEHGGGSANASSTQVMSRDVPLEALLPRDMRLEMGPLGVLRVELEQSEERRRTAAEELREVPEASAAAIHRLRALLAEEAARGLEMPNHCDLLLFAALRACHWYPDSAFQRLRSYFAFKAAHPRVANLSTARADAVAASRVICILPHRDQHGRRLVILSTGGMWDPKQLTREEVLASMLMCEEVAMAEPDTQVAGVVILWDVVGLTLSRVLKFTPSFASMLTALVQDCMPLRVKAFHIVNQTPLFDIGYNVIKPFMREKLRSRIFFHGTNWESLAQHVDRAALPAQYGGLRELDLEPEKQMIAFRTLHPYYQELCKYGYKRPPK